LSKFEANLDGFATSFGGVGIVEAMITKKNIYRMGEEFNKNKEKRCSKKK
jgi:hypothetical protein